MSFTADLHLHSSFAYATSSALTLDNLAEWAGLKGIDLLATADFTHPIWFAELGEKLADDGSGLFTYGGVRFVLGTEVSCVFRQGGRGRRVHLLVFAPTLAAAGRFNAAAARYGNIEADGRPTLSLSVRDLAERALAIDPEFIVMPAHAWTPWYGVYGSKSGFDSLDEAFGDLAGQIPAIETGLSSDPEMNWVIPELDGKAIVSFSDAHSLPKLGREVTVFGGELSYAGLTAALRNNRVEYTVEMYPEEGKYHYDGHRKCGITRHPQLTRQLGSRCPECGRPLTLGVLHRILSLGEDVTAPAVTGNNVGEQAARENAAGQAAAPELPESAITSAAGRPPFVKLAPLLDIIAAVRGRGANTRGVTGEYRRIVKELGTELHTLLWASGAELAGAAGQELADAILRARRGDIRVEPGYDGVYGKLSFDKPDTGPTPSSPELPSPGLESLPAGRLL